MDTMTSNHDEGPVYYREIQKNAFLKRIPNEVNTSKLRPLGHKKPPLRPMWTLFCVHNGRTPFLEQYSEPDPSGALAHRPAWRACLRTARHVTASVKPHIGDEYDFLIDTDQGPVRMLAPDWESMQEWVSTLRNKLHELRILAKGENVYCAAPVVPQHRAAARDPTSPLPPTPAVPPDRVPGIELATPSRSTEASEAPAPPTLPESNQQPVDISDWAEIPLPSTSASEVTTRKVARICGQNICLDDSILKRDENSDEDEGASETEDFTQRLVVSDAPDTHDVDVHRSPQRNVTVIQVCNRDTNNTFPGQNLDSLIPENPALPTSEPGSFVNIVHTDMDSIQNRSDYGHLSLTTTVSLTGEVNADSMYERLCMASTSDTRTSDLAVDPTTSRIPTSVHSTINRLPSTSIDLATSTPTSMHAATSKLEVLTSRIPTSVHLATSKNYATLANTTTSLDSTVSKSPETSVDSTTSRITTSRNPVKSVHSETSVDSPTSRKPTTYKSITSHHTTSMDTTTSRNLPISVHANTSVASSTSRNPPTPKNLITLAHSTTSVDSSTSRSPGTKSFSNSVNPTTSMDAATSRNPLTSLDPSTSARIQERTRKSSLPNLDPDPTYEYLYPSQPTNAVLSPISRAIRPNVERSQSQNAYDATPRLRENQIRIQNNSPKRDTKIEKSEPPTKPIWKRGLTELSLLSRLRGLGQNKRQDSPTRQENDSENRAVTSPVKVVHRSRPQGRVDSTRRRSNSLSNGHSPPHAGPMAPLRARQAATLRAEQRRGAAIAASVSVRDPPVFADHDGQVWVARWGAGGARWGGRSGDRVAALAGTSLTNAAHARSLMKASHTPLVDILFHRVPLGKIYVITKRDRETIGVRLDSDCVIRSVTSGSGACRVGLPPPSPPRWAVTEVNNRPLDLLKSNEEEVNRLSLHGSEASIIIQPAPFVKKLRAAVKANKSLLTIR